MDGFGFGGGGFGGGWDAKASYETYKLANGGTPGGGSSGCGSGARKAQSKGDDIVSNVIVWGCMAGGFILFMGLGLDMLSAILLAIPFTLVAGSVIAVIVAMATPNRERRGKSEKKDDDVRTTPVK